MKINKLLRYILLYSILSLTLPTITTAGTLALSLPDALSITLKENKTINFHAIDKIIAETTADFEKAIFIPFFETSISYNSYQWNSSPLSDYKEHLMDSYIVSLTKKNAFGGTESINFSTGMDKIKYFTQGIDSKEYNSSVYLKYEQPLLKAFGRKITYLEIDKALINIDLIIQKYEDMKSKILFNVFKDYFFLYMITEEIKLKREIRKNTEEIYNIVREKVEARMLPITELNTIEVVINLQDKELLDLKNKRKQQENRLIYSMSNDSRPEEIRELTLSTSYDEVYRIFSQPIPSELQKKMESLDFELLKSKSELKLLEKDRLEATNDLKPELTLSVELGFDGYDLNEKSESIKNISSNNYRTLVTGKLSLPVIRTAARSKLSENEEKVKQTKILISNRENEISNIVYEFFNNLETIINTLELSNKIVTTSKENLDNEIEKLIAGKSTVPDTLFYQTNYINAQLDMLNNKIEHLMLIGTYYLYTRDMELFVNG